MAPHLKPAWFHILLALGDGPQHGYALRTLVEERTEGQITLWPATLYGSLRQLEELGLIVETTGDDAPDDDQRRRWFALTAAGRAALAGEADRMHALVKAARSSRALRNA